MRYLIILAIFLGGCIGLGDTDSTVKGGNGDGDGDGGSGDGDGCKIEGSQIGEGGVVIYLGSKTVTFDNWIGKSGASGEFVGFSLTLSGGDSVSYVVKAGTERFPGTATTWMHPAGEGGSAAKGISNVDMCDDPDADGGGDGGDDGGGDGGGDDGGGGDDPPIIL
jgi:hypothetical protein